MAGEPLRPRDEDPLRPVARDRRAGVVIAAEDPDLDFDGFCRREHASVLGLAYVLSGSTTAAEELTQDAFFEAYRRWDRIRRYDKPGAWVRRVVANRAVSRRRRMAAELRAMARVGARRTPWTEISAGDDAVWAAVRRLPTRQAQVVALRYVDDLSLARVAEVLDISEGTAKTHLQRARAALAAALGTTADAVRAEADESDDVGEAGRGSTP